MILKTAQNRKVVIEYLESVKEDDFINEIVIPIFTYTGGYSLLRINNHGPGEHGKDLIFSRFVTVFNDFEYVAVQAKAVDIYRSNIVEIADQLVRALKVPFPNKSGTSLVCPNYAIMVNAKRQTNDAFFEFPSLVASANIKFINQEEVCGLILNTGNVPDSLLSKLNQGKDIEVDTEDDKLVIATILNNVQSEIEQLLDHRLKFIKPNISEKAKKLVIDYIFDLWQQDSSWAGTVNPMKWLNLYFEFIYPDMFINLLKVFQEFTNSRASKAARQDTRAVINKINNDHLKYIKKEFIYFCGECVVNPTRNNISMVIEKLNVFVQSGIELTDTLKELAEKINRVHDFNVRQNGLTDELRADFQWIQKTVYFNPFTKIPPAPLPPPAAHS